MDEDKSIRCYWRKALKSVEFSVKFTTIWMGNFWGAFEPCGYVGLLCGLSSYTFDTLIVIHVTRVLYESKAQLQSAIYI